MFTVLTPFGMVNASGDETVTVVEPADIGSKTAFTRICWTTWNISDGN